MHVVDHFGPLEFPGVAEAQPLVGIFLLPALRNDLAEQPEIITDAVTDRGDCQRRHAFHEARGKPAETAIAERGIRFAFAQFGEAGPEIAERGVEHRQQPHIVERVGEQPADQEFQREIINPLGAGVVALLFGGQPAMHDAVAQRQRRRLIPIVAGRHRRVLADRKPKLGEDRALDLGEREFVDRWMKRLLSSLESLSWHAESPLARIIRRLSLHQNARMFVRCDMWISARTGPISQLPGASLMIGFAG